MVATCWPGAAIVAGVLAFQLAGIGILLAGRGSPGASGLGLSIVLGATIVLAASLFFRERRVNHSRAGEARIADDWLRLAMESSKSVAWDWDLRSGRDMWFGDLKTMFGLEKDAHEGRVEDFRQRVHPDDREFVFRAVAQARQSRTLYRATFRLIRPDGVVRLISATGKFYYAPNGEAIRMLGMAADITEFGEIKHQVREGQQRLNGIVEAAMDAIIAVDHEQRVQVFNAAAERMFGCSAADAIGSHLERFLPGHLRLVDREQVRRFGETGVSRRAMGALGQFWAMRADGEEFPIEASISHTGLDGKRLFTVILRDITERRRAEEALRESEERFRLMADSAPVMLWMSGQDRLCNYFNRTWLQFTGRTMEAELGNGWVEGVHRDDLERCISTYEQSFDRRETFRMEYRLRRQDGEYRWVLDTGVPRLAADGAFIGYIGSCVDITEDKLAQNVLSGLSQKLMDAQEKERAWIARELHDDVGQRMAVLTIDLERLRENLPGGAGELRLRIGEVSGRVSDLGKDLQVIAHRLHSSKLEYLGIAAAAREFCRDLSDKHGVTIAFTHEGVRRDLPKEVALALFRVLQEASTNTIKHAGVSHFSVALRGGDDDVQLEVVDSGIGFDPKAVRGYGLGLVSMQERMSLVEGAIAIDSRLGSGTRVRAQVALSASRRLAVGGV